MQDNREPEPENVLADPDSEVWVVERNPGSGWRVSAVLTSFEDAEAYERDLRAFMKDYPDDFPEQFKTDPEKIRTRHGSRGSPTKMFETYPPESSEESR